MAEALIFVRRQHTPGRCSTRAPACITAVAGTARREGRTPNVGDLARCGWQTQLPDQDRQIEAVDRRGVGGAHSTDEGGESRWREGDALPGDATPAAKDRRLW